MSENEVPPLLNGRYELRRGVMIDHKARPFQKKYMPIVRRDDGELVAVANDMQYALTPNDDFLEALLRGKPRTVANLRPYKDFLTEGVRQLPRAYHNRNDEPCDTHVYFIQGENTGLIKIGKADDILNRMAGHQLGSPDVLLLRWFYRAPASHERWLHRFFHASRVHGEWFRPTPDLVEYINNGSPGCYPKRDEES